MNWDISTYLIFSFHKFMLFVNNISPIGSLFDCTNYCLITESHRGQKVLWRETISRALDDAGIIFLVVVMPNPFILSFFSPLVNLIIHFCLRKLVALRLLDGPDP